MIPNHYPFRVKGKKPNVKEAMKNGFIDSLSTVKSILSDVNPPDEYWEYYESAMKSVEENKGWRKFYWVLNYLHPLCWANAIAQYRTIKEKDQVLKYARVKNDTMRNIGVGVVGCLLSVFHPIFLLAICPVLAQLIPRKLKIPGEIRRNVDCFIWKK